MRFIRMRRLGMRLLSFYYFLFMLPVMGCASSPELILFEKNKSPYAILIPSNPTPIEEKSALVLQDYFARVSNFKLEIIKESPKGNLSRNNKLSFISVGKTNLAKPFEVDFRSEEFLIQQDGKSLIFQGVGKGLLFGVYSFIEETLECNKWYANEKAVCPIKTKIAVSVGYKRQEAPAFNYREVYSPVEKDQEYIDWHKIHVLDDLWGLWGHTFDVLVPPVIYFKDHPEYFSFYNGGRHSDQLCLSNPEVLKIASRAVREAIADNPLMTFWSISPNDNTLYCTCENCKKMDDLEGGPQGSLIHFVNKIAQQFPQHHFTTLAYTYTARPTKTIKPLENVTLILSNIEADRTLPVPRELSAKPFRSQLDGWRQKTDHLFIWDYYTQFTNYLAPFPNLYTFKENFQYYKEKGVRGIFAQSSGETYSEMVELKSYLLAKLLWNPNADIDRLTERFLAGYYGKAAPMVKEYIQRMQENLKGEVISIYGNPIDHHTGYLSLKNMDEYSSIMDKAEIAAEGNALFEKRIKQLRLSQEYTFLQQARFYGIEPHGIFHQVNGGDWEVNERLKSRIANFVEECIANGVIELSEGGLSPKEYQAEWDSIINLGVKNNLALNAEIIDTKSEYESSFPAKGWRTLVDGNPGYNDYSYNWLCFYNKPMELTVDLKAVKQVNKVSLNFLVDQRHWIFGPKAVNVTVSADGINFHEIGDINLSNPEESYEIGRTNVTFVNSLPSIRFIKILAISLDSLPQFRYHKTKKPMMACDEIWVE